MKKILLLGDSIRQSYAEPLARLLEGTAGVYSPQDNGRFAKYTYWHLEQWIREAGDPDLIHWNKGIWDVYRPHGKEMFSAPEEYMRDMERIYNAIAVRGGSGGGAYVRLHHAGAWQSPLIPPMIRKKTAGSIDGDCHSG